MVPPPPIYEVANGTMDWNPHFKIARSVPEERHMCNVLIADPL